MVMMTNPFVKFANQPTDNFFERLGGSTLRNPAVTSALSASDYTSSNFTTVGSTVAITSNSVVFSSTPTNGDNGQYMQIDPLAESDTWSLNFKLNVSVHNTFDNYYLALTNTSGAINSANQLGLQTQGGGYQRFTFGTRISGTNTESTSSNGTVSTGTDYYATVSSDGTTATFKVWTNSGRTGTAHVTLTKSVSGLGTLNYIQHRSRNSGDSSVWTGTVSEIEATTKPTLTSVASPKVKQHFIEWFSGKQLPSYWGTGNTGGGGSGAMTDEVDGGYKMSSAYNNSLNGIHFSDKRQFSPTASVCILTLKRQTATSSNDAVRGGFVNTFTGSTNYAYVQDNESATYKTLKTADGSTEYSANSTIAVDTDWHNYKIEMKSSSIDWSIDGVTQATVSNVPQSSTKLQPMSAGGNLTTANGTPEGRIRYMECYNT